MSVRARLFFGLSVGAGGVLAACTSANTQHEPTLTTNARLQVAEAAEAAGDSDLVDIAADHEAVVTFTDLRRLYGVAVDRDDGAFFCDVNL